MGNVVVGLRIMPSSPEINLEKIKKTIEELIPAYGALSGIKEKHIAFGLVALEVTIIVPDKLGGSEKIEQEIAKIEGVGSIEIISTSLL